MYSNANLDLLRKEMKKRGVKAYLILTGDPHNSEEPAAYFASERAFFCPFKGDNAYVLITEDKALLFSDGRFAISAPVDINGTPFEFIELYRLGNLSPEETIIKNRFFPLMTDFSIISPLDLKALQKGGEVRDGNFRELVMGAPKLSKDKLWSFDDPTYSCSSHLDKLAKVREAMEEKGAEALLLTTLDDIAYLTGLRGNDIANTPLFYSYVYITSQKAVLFVDPTRISSWSGYEIKPYEEVEECLKNNSSLLTWVDPNECNAKLYNLLENPIDAEMPTRLMKAIKDEKEIENTISIQEEDGVALLKFIAYLEKQPLESLDEWKLAEVLHDFRTEGKRFIDESFVTISALGANASMMHYAPTSQIHSSYKEGMMELLLDSGGQYYGGTTDTTRTFCLGTPSDEFIHDFTLTLKSVIALSKAVFIEGSTGTCLDMLSREVMWKEGMDYKCGTGHGVGYLNVVHESPNGFRYKAAKGKNDGSKNVPGMITTVEPGVYKANKYGIRIENNLLTVKAFSTPDGNFFRFQTITYVPIDTKAIDRSMLTPEEIDWLNAYHQDVYNHLSPRVSSELLDTLKRLTAPLK